MEYMIETSHFTKIILPTRAQADTLVAIFILKTFGESRFPGISKAHIEFLSVLPAGETEISMEERGVLLIDIGGGKFDHHIKNEQITSSDLIAEHIGVKDDPALLKLLEYARRDDFFGKGTISEDPLDRAFGLSALITNLNKSWGKEPSRVIDIVMPILRAHYEEEVRRTKELPEEFEQKKAAGRAEIFDVKQRDKKLRVVILDSDNTSMPGYLRSQNGGRFDVVAQWSSGGHVNILTRPTKHIDLRSLALLIRTEESNLAGKNLDVNPRHLAGAGRLDEAPEWYYDTATNSLQNGGINPKNIPATKIPRFSFQKILEIGLSEKLWSPVEHRR